MKNEMLDAPKTGGLAPFLDKYVGRLWSRKLMVFAVGTVALYFGRLESSEWIWVAGIYIGGQTVVDAVRAWKHGLR